MVQTEQLLDELQRALLESEALRESQRRRAARLAALAQLGAQVVSELDNDRLVGLIVEAARQVTGASFAALFTRESEAPGIYAKTRTFLGGVLEG